ncbi:MAG: hypothetical protein ACOCV2_03305 [Persicimonas sp.]
MRRIWSFFILAVGLLLFTTGCPSFSTLHTATPVEEGETEMTLSASYLGMGASDAETGDSVNFSVPTFEVAGRHGLSPDLDVGAKIYPIGMGVDVNYAFLNEPNFALSANPYVGLTRAGNAGYGFALLNLLADVAKTESVSATLGLKPGVLYGFGGGSASASPVVGGMAGVKLGLSDSFSIMPNVDVLYPLADTGPFNTFLYTGGIAFNF